MYKLFSFIFVLLISCTLTNAETIWYSDGSYATRNGNTTWYSDGSYATRNGNTTWYSDGSYATHSNY